MRMKGSYDLCSDERRSGHSKKRLWHRGVPGGRGPKCLREHHHVSFYNVWKSRDFLILNVCRAKTTGRPHRLGQIGAGGPAVSFPAAFAVRVPFSDEDLFFPGSAILQQLSQLHWCGTYPWENVSQWAGRPQALCFSTACTGNAQTWINCRYFFREKHLKLYIFAIFVYTDNIKLQTAAICEWISE